MRYVALLRGVNVGRAKRVAMADLRQVFADLGFTDVKTLLNSGNVVFSSSRKPSPAKIEQAVLDRTGVSSKVTLVAGAELAKAAADCPLLDIATDPSRLAMAVLASPGDARKLRPLADRDFTPERLSVGSRVAYIWCPDGFAASNVSNAIAEVLGDGVTTRNWATVQKILAAL